MTGWCLGTGALGGHLCGVHLGFVGDKICYHLFDGTADGDPYQVLAPLEAVEILAAWGYDAQLSDLNYSLRAFRSAHETLEQGICPRSLPPVVSGVRAAAGLAE